MIVHQSEQTERQGLRGLLSQWWAAGLVALAIVAGAFFFGAWAQSHGHTAHAKRALRQRMRVPRNMLHGLRSPPRQFTLNIKHKHVQKLEHERRQTSNTDGLLITTDSDDAFVPGSLTVDGQTYGVKVRNKGNWRDARGGGKWSLRVKLKDGKAVMGMSRFSLHSPATKSDLTEWFFHRWLAHLDLVAMRYDFVNVTLNGKDFGLHAIEESFTRRLIEHNQRREGVIVRFDEYWSFYFMFVKKVDTSWLPEMFALSAIKGYEGARVQASPALRQQFKAAKNLLESFRRSELTTSEVFDVPKLARLFALTDVFGRDHNLELRNVKFYYNPITAKLEPVGYDQHEPLQRRTGPLVGDYRQMLGDTTKLIWLDHFYRDPAFYQAYLDALHAMSRPGTFDAFVKQVATDYDHALGMLYREDATFDIDYLGIMRENIAIIGRKLRPERSIDAFLAATHRGTTGDARGDIAELQLVNIHTLPMHVTSVTFDGLPLPLEGTATWPVLEAKAAYAKMPYTTVRVRLPEGATRRKGGLAGGLQVHSRVWGVPHEVLAPVRPWSYVNPAFVRSDFMRRRPNHSEFPFVQVDEIHRVIRLLPGRHHLRKSLILPAGYRVMAAGGVEIDLSNGAMILSRSPVFFAGEPTLPIIIRSSDKTGQGFAVLTAGERSEMSHVRFEDLSNPVQPGWSMPGSVTFHEGDVVIRDCVFARNRSEDGLNLVRSTMLLERLAFIKTKSDAFDCDFCRGELRDSTFLDCGNDGVDVSGSEITLTNVRIDGSGDKAVSAGEDSHMTVRKIRVRRSELALCSKDHSHIDAKGVDIDTSRVGFAVFMKKAEFGVATMRAADIKTGKMERLYLLETGSQLILDGVAQVPSQSNVKEVLYGAKYGKSSH